MGMMLCETFSIAYLINPMNLRLNDSNHMIILRISTLVAVLLLVFGLPACGDDDTDDDGVFVKRDILWTANRIDGGRPKVIGDVSSNLVWDDLGLVLVAGADASKSKFIALDLMTGERRWEWADHLGSPDTEGVDVYSSARHGDTLVYTAGTRIYAINVRDGSTVWRQRPNITFGPNDMAADGHLWYNYADHHEVDTVGQYGLVEGRFSDPVFTHLVNPPWPSVEPFPGALPRVTSFEVLPAPDNHLIAIVYQIVVPGTRFAREQVSFLGLYDRAGETWVYDDIRLNDLPASRGVALTPARLAEGTIYVAINNEVFAHDVRTGDRKWSQKLPREVFTSGLTVAEGLCVVNCEDKWLYGFDAETGVRRWGLPSAQLSTELEGRVLDGVVYWVGRSEASLFAADLRTGQLLWRLRADAVLGRDVLFNANLYAVPGRDGRPGRIVALAGETVVCFEAHR